MKMIVFIKDVLDTKVPLECNEETGRLKQDWNVPMLNPDDGMAIASALKIKKSISEARITVVHWGPPSGEQFIRNALALGCDDGLRIWDEALGEIHSEAKAMVFARAATILGFDFLFTGTKSLDTGSSQLGVLLASSLQVPCITRVIGIDEIRTETVKVTRKLDRGYREQVESARPLIMAVEADEEVAPHISFSVFVHAAERIIRGWGLPEIGIPRESIRQAESRLQFGPLRHPEPRLQFIQPPDSSLPAFDRRRQIGEGFEQKRTSKIARGSEDEIAESLFQALFGAGCLNHLKKQ